MQDRSGVDVEELLVETYAPEVAFGARRTAASAGGSKEGALVGLHLGAAVGVGVEGCEILHELRGSIYWVCEVLLELWNSRSSFRSVCPRSPCWVGERCCGFDVAGCIALPQRQRLRLHRILLVMPLLRYGEVRDS